MKKKALIIVAHPDDEVIGVGGTILKLREEYGYDVHIEFMTTKKFDKKWESVEAVSEILETSYNVPSWSTYGELLYPLTLDGEPITNLVDYIEPIIKEHNPEVIFTHHIGDLNQDHRAVAEAVMIATRPYPGQVVKRLYSFDTASSTEWSFGEFNKFEPNVFMDISIYVNIKHKALEIYKEEIKDLEFPHPRSIESIEMNNKLKGSVVGLSSVETFRLIRSIDLL